MAEEARPPAARESDGSQDAYSRIVGQLADLLQAASDWLRQEAEAVVREKIVPPLQKVGLAIASASAAASMMVMGAVFIAVAGIMWLGAWIGYAWAFFMIGVVYLIGSTVFLVIKVRSMQR